MQVLHPEPEELERCEIIDGVVYDMAPPPSERHQAAVCVEPDITIVCDLSKIWDKGYVGIFADLRIDLAEIFA